MPHVIITAGAARDIERVRRFLRSKDRSAAEYAGQTIFEHLRRLQDFAEVGRPSGLRSGDRELVIPFGAAGYVVLYRYSEKRDEVEVLALRHQREAGYLNR